MGKDTPAEPMTPAADWLASLHEMCCNGGALADCRVCALRLAARQRAAQLGEPFSVAVRAVMGLQAEDDPRPCWGGSDGIEAPIIWAPWTADQTASLSAFQTALGFFPETCYGDDCPAVRETGVTVKRAALVARENGWHCPACGRAQEWAWSFVADGGWRELPVPDGTTLSGFWAAIAGGPSRPEPTIEERLKAVGGAKA